MLDSGVKVAFVTHFYDLAHGFYADERADALFLRADRAPDGSQAFRLTEGGPELTSHAKDSCRSSPTASAVTPTRRTGRAATR